MTTAKKATTKPSVKTVATKIGAKPKTAVKTEKMTPAVAAPIVTTLASREEHFNRIQKEAYFLAEKDGFKDDPTKYWLSAEANVLRTKR